MVGRTTGSTSTPPTPPPQPDNLEKAAKYLGIAGVAGTLGALLVLYTIPTLIGLGVATVIGVPTGVYLHHRNVTQLDPDHPVASSTHSVATEMFGEEREGLISPGEQTGEPTGAPLPVRRQRAPSPQDEVTLATGRRVKESPENTRRFELLLNAVKKAHTQYQQNISLYEKQAHLKVIRDLVAKVDIESGMQAYLKTKEGREATLTFYEDIASLFPDGGGILLAAPIPGQEGAWKQNLMDALNNQLGNPRKKKKPTPLRGVQMESEQKKSSAAAATEASEEEPLLQLDQDRFEELVTSGQYGRANDMLSELDLTPEVPSDPITTYHRLQVLLSELGTETSVQKHNRLLELLRVLMGPVNLWELAQAAQKENPSSPITLYNNLYAVIPEPTRQWYPSNAREAVQWKADFMEVLEAELKGA